MSLCQLDKMCRMLVSVLFALCAVALSEAQVCKTNAECGATECCYIQPEFLVASKRQLVLPPVGHVHHDTGVCESYKFEGDRCNSIETMNGHCGCATGLRCTWVPDVTTVGPGGRRSQVYHPEPGADRCTPVV